MQKNLIRALTFTFTVILSLNVQSNEKFEHWKVQYIKRASKKGLPKNFLTKTLKQITLDPKVIEKESNQVLFDTNQDYNEFIKNWLRSNPSRIEMAKEHLKKHHNLLEKIETKYQVDKEIIISLWAVETLFGEIQGDYNVVQSLATLSFSSRRKKFFELQLNAALRLIYKGHVKLEHFKGSWAGATGQCQFMPSNIAPYAVDYDGDGKKDIWTNTADLFASIANFLKKVGWKKQKAIGSLAFNKSSVRLNANKHYTLTQYNQLGFRNSNGQPLSGAWTKRGFSEIPLKNSPLVLKGSNYKPLLAWNRSSLFAAFNIIIVDALK